MKKALKKLADFIVSNPPLDKDGSPKWWSSSTWQEQLDKQVPGWKGLVERPDTWKAIRNLRPRRDYDDLLEVILRWAPDEVLVQYLTSNDDVEAGKAYEVLTEDYGRRLTSSVWKLLDTDTLEVSKKAFDISIEKLARRGFRIPNNEFISTSKKLRGIGKWIAQGGVIFGAQNIMNPRIGPLVGYLIVEGFFVLIDP